MESSSSVDLEERDFLRGTCMVGVVPGWFVIFSFASSNLLGSGSSLHGADSSSFFFIFAAGERGREVKITELSLCADGEVRDI